MDLQQLRMGRAVNELWLRIQAWIHRLTNRWLGLHPNGDMHDWFGEEDAKPCSCGRERPARR